MSVKALKGFKDILPGEVETWQRIEQTARDIFQRFGFNEIKVPILEKTTLFKRSIGEATDIVEKEMYTFADRNGASLTMRPEGTAPVLRAYVEHGLQVKKPVQRLYTIGPMFRHERPQKGRLRQFHQLSAEVLGSGLAMLDAEVMAMAALVLRELGLTVSLEINSLGCRKCRPGFNQALVDFLAQHADKLCNDCERRRQTNPLRVLDCKNEHCREQYKNSPSILEHLCKDCREHFTEVRKNLDLLNIDYKVNSFMVRGLDYYCRTTFELLTDNLGAQSAVGAGGRYDGLVKQLGGPDVPGIGFALGLERLALLMEHQGLSSPESKADIFIAALGEEALNRAFILVHALRNAGLAATMDHQGRSLKNQMKQAGRMGASFTLIMGEEELSRNKVILRDMASREQQDLELSTDLSSWAADLKKIINQNPS